MIPRRFEPVVFGLVLSGLMLLIVSGVATLRVAGLTPAFPTQWLGAWLPSWAIAFPAVLIVAPLARRLVARVLRPD